MVSLEHQKMRANVSSYFQCVKTKNMQETDTNLKATYFVHSTEMFKNKVIKVC